MPIKKKKKKKPPIYPSKNKMTVDGFYDYITRYMSPEDALKKLLISSLGRYEKLKVEARRRINSPFRNYCDCNIRVIVRYRVEIESVVRV